jgi:hypothetical protein
VNIFLDTTAYSSVFSEEPNIRPFLKLKEILESKKGNLVLTQQIIDEISRGAGKRIDDAWKKVTSDKIDIQKIISSNFPEAILEKNKTEIEKLKKSTEEYYSERDKKFEKDIDEAERIISEILSFAKPIPVTDKIIERAKVRSDLRNPPRKDKGPISYGDAINWEILLENFSDDLVIVSYDPDYGEPYRGKQRINRFLKEEWNKKTGKNVILYSTLREVINSQEEKEIFSKKDIDKEAKAAKAGSIYQFYNPIVFTTKNMMSEKGEPLIWQPSASVFAVRPESVMNNAYFVDSDVTPIGVSPVADISATDGLSIFNNNAGTGLFIDNDDDASKLSS